MVKACGWGDPGDLPAAGVVVVPGLGEEVADELLVGIGEFDLDAREALAPNSWSARRQSTEAKSRHDPDVVVASRLSFKAERPYRQARFVVRGALGTKGHRCCCVAA